MILECRILGADGKAVSIPRISIAPNAEDLHVILLHCQFPVYLAFSMIINKSQGKSVQNVGLDCRTHVFHMVNSMLLFLDALQEVESNFFFQILKKVKNTPLYALKFWMDLPNHFVF